MEVNCFFATVLDTLGYEVVPTGARVLNPSGEYGGWYAESVYLPFTNLHFRLI